MIQTGGAPLPAPGTNIKGRLAGGTWTFLLPTFELGRVLCLGRLSAAELVRVAGIAREVNLVGAGRATADHENVKAASDLASIGGTFDLVRIAPDGWSLLEEAGGAGRLVSLLVPGGLVWAEHVRSTGRRAGASGGEPPPGLREINRYRLWPLRGEIREAAPVADRAAAAFVAATRGAGGGTRTRLSTTLRSWVDDRRGERIGQLLTTNGLPASGAAAGGDPPRYLVDAAAGHRVELGGSFCLLARGQFNSQKVLVFGFGSDGGPPSVLVKLPREPALSERLENEHRALRGLEQVPVAAGRVPRLLFFGRHAGLTILGESVITGRPFREAMGRDRDRTLVRDAIAFFVELGRVTAQPSEPGESGAHIRALLERFTRIYRLTPTQRVTLEEAVGRLELAHGTSLPVVFQHGDPGTWNLLATPDGRTALLDWEAAERRGVPLWDLLYFLRSYVVTGGRAGGLRSRLDVFAATFVDGSPFSPTVVEAIGRYREAVGLSAELVWPLFLTCWVHRAVKEAGRLAPEQVETGQYAQLVRLCLDRPGPTLNRIRAGQPMSLPK